MAKLTITISGSSSASKADMAEKLKSWLYVQYGYTDVTVDRSQYGPGEMLKGFCRDETAEIKIEK